MDSVESVSLGVWVGAGTRHEPERLNGISHLLEHMAFKGTARRSAQAIAEEIEAVGGQLDAYTSRETTAYYAKVLSEDQDLALDILADILQHSTFDAAELAREQQVILREIGQAADTPDDIIFDHFQETAYPGQPIGWPVLGQGEIVARLTRDDLFSYQARNYGAGGMVIAAAGKVDHGDFLAKATAAFGGLAAQPEPETRPARYSGGEFRQSRRLEQLHVVLGFDGVGYRDPDYYVAAVFSTLMGGGMSSRLFQEVREKRGLAYSVFTFNAAHSDGGLFGLYSGTSADQARSLTPVLTDELLRAANEPPPQDELARARAQLKAGLLMGRERTSARVEQLANQLLVYGRTITSEEIVERIEAVDAEAIEGFARRLLASQPTLAALGPIRKLEPLDRLSVRLQ
jgi:predicted Zn-dependent peptidase